MPQEPMHDILGLIAGIAFWVVAIWFLWKKFFVHMYRGYKDEAYFIGEPNLADIGRLEKRLI